VLDLVVEVSGEATWWIGATFDPINGKLLQKGIVPSNYLSNEQ